MGFDYLRAKECQSDAYQICHQCGQCGRKFDNGFMYDEGNTHPIEQWEEDESHNNIE